MGNNPDTFTGLRFATIAFFIRRIDPSTCVLGAQECAGTATLTLAGQGVTNADTPPFPTPPATPTQMWAWADPVGASPA